MKAKQKVKIGITVGLLATAVGIAGFHSSTFVSKHSVLVVSDNINVSVAEAMAKQLVQNMNANIQAGEKSGQFKSLDDNLYQNAQLTYHSIQMLFSQTPNKDKAKLTKRLNKEYFSQMKQVQEYQQVIHNNQTTEAQINHFEQQMAQNPFASDRQQEYQQLKQSMDKERTALVKVQNPTLREGLLDHYMAVSTKWDITMSVLPTLQQSLDDLKGFAKNGNTFPALFQEKVDLVQQMIDEISANNIKAQATRLLAQYQKQYQKNLKSVQTSVSANAVTLNLDRDVTHKDVQFAQLKGLLDYVNQPKNISVLVQNGNPIIYRDANGVQGAVDQKDLLMEYVLYLGIPLSKDNLSNQVASVINSATKKVQDDSYSISVENSVLTIEWRESK